MPAVNIGRIVPNSGTLVGNGVFQAGQGIDKHLYKNRGIQYAPRVGFAYDITGEQLLHEQSKDVNVSRITLDLDRGIYHENFNIEGRDKLLKEHPQDVAQEKYLPAEEWFVLKAQRPGVSARWRDDARNRCPDLSVFRLRLRRLTGEG